MSTIKIPIISKSSVVNPATGEVIIFPDSDKGGNISQRDKDGNVTDLTEASNAIFNSETTVTKFRVDEFNRTITSAELTSMSHDKFKNPFGGIELLPAPGEGKCYIIAMDGLFAQYVSNSNFGYQPKPYSEFRTIDVYYPNETGSYDILNNRIFSIPLMAMPHSELYNRRRPESFQLDQALWKYNRQESLGIDRQIDSTVFQQQKINSVESAYGSYSIINTPLYIGTNGEIEKQLASTDGEINVKFWYAIIDLSDIHTTYTDSNSLPDYALSQFKPYDYTLNQEIIGLDFLDNLSRKLPLSFFENYALTGPSFDPEDFNTGYRARRDSYLKSLNEYKVALSNGVNGFETGTNHFFDHYDVVSAPMPAPFYGLHYDSLFWGTGPDYTFRGLSFSRNVIPAREAAIKYPDGLNVSNLPYDVSEGSIIYTGVYSVGSPNFDFFMFDNTAGRISELQITNPGTGYSPGETISFTGGGANSPAAGWLADAEAIITEVGGSGEIIRVNFTDPNGYNIFGGQFYTSAPSVSISTVGGSSAVLTPVISSGQWVPFLDFIRTTSFGDTVNGEDLEITFRATRDANSKASNEYVLSVLPFLYSALLLPEFQVEKYKL